MKKTKIIFSQTLMITTAILFGLGIQAMIKYVSGGVTQIVWQWYIPLSLILTGLLCSLPTLLLLSQTARGGWRDALRLVVHFFCICAVVSLCGYLFKWYTDWRGYVPIVAMVAVIYLFVWVATLWITNSDAKKINEAIKEIQDTE